MDLGVIVNSIIAILESKASFVTAAAFEVGFAVLLYKHPDDETYLFWVIVLGVALVLRGCFFCYGYNQYRKRSETQSRLVYERRAQDEKEKQEHELAEAKYVYDRLSRKSQESLYSICKIAKKSTKEGSYIINNIIRHQQKIMDLEILLSNDFTLVGWINIDENGESFCFTVKPPLNKLIEREKGYD